MGLELFSDRSLTRENVTAASRIMLPAYALHAWWFGIVYAFDPQGRLHMTPGLAMARYIGVPFVIWGAMILLVAIMLTWALLGHYRQLAIFALYCYLAIFGWWALIYGGSAFLTLQTSLGGAAWPFLGACACAASARSLSKGDK